MTLNGIDISDWQHGIDLSKVPCDFVISKATQGTSYVSPDCVRQVEQAASLGKKIGVYHYVGGGNATAEANYFVNNCENWVGKHLFVIDWEREQNAAWGDESYLDALVAQVVKRTGNPPMLYTMASRLEQVRAVADRHDCGLWIAQYADDTPTGYQSTPWNEGAYSCAMRQYTSVGTLGGYSNLDLDKFYGDGAAWDAYATGGGAEPPSTAQPTQTTTASVDVLQGTYRVDVDKLNVRDQPSLSGNVVATYSTGQTVNLDRWGAVADGYIWGRYTSYGGAVRYIALAPADKSSWYLVRA